MTVRELKIADLDTGRAHLIEANAGTGKTYAIANLFLRFVLDGQPVARILVVTFTEAATDELRQRIRARLAEALDYLEAEAPEPSGDRWFDGLRKRIPEGEQRRQACLRLELALLSINEAPIHTIHGFCQRMLSELAFRGGQPFDQEQADDAPLREQALLDWWRRQTYASGPEDWQRFQNDTGGLADFRERLAPLLAPSPPELSPAPLDADGIARLERKIGQLQSKLARQWKKHGKAAIRLLLESKALSRTRTNAQKPEDLQPVLEEITAHLAERPDIPLPPDRLARIATRGIHLKPSQCDCPDFQGEPFKTADALREAYGARDLQRSLRLLCEARDFVQARLQRIKQAQGLMSFDDMIVRLHQALHAGDAQADALGAELARRLPVVMVDEFQDTDPLQYGIFRAIHRAGGSDHTLIMIGDPKQAIYGFRGGDIFAYLQAAKEADRRWSLKVNWRSSPQMIAAVNRVFKGDNPFAFDEIAYQSSKPPGKDHQRPGLEGADPPPAPLLVHRIPSEIEEEGKLTSLNKAKATDRVARSVAARIHWLLRESGLRYRGEPLREGDICVLIRSWHEADVLREALRPYRIRAVSTGRARLWDSAEAQGLRWLLEAALNPDDRRLARQALAAPFLALGPDQLAPFAEDSRRWGHWVALLRQVREHWQGHGVIAAFYALLQGLDEALGLEAETGWLARLEQPERSLTNLLHLAELLQQAAREQGDAERLLAWMRDQAAQAAEEDALLRLESDEKLVRITTMHASKGLQYPVVLAPFLWYCTLRGDRKSIAWHETEGDVTYHRYRPWPDPDDPLPGRLRDKERLSEDLRLAYVALTRAQAHCELWVGNVGKRPGRTALHWLLSGRKHDFTQGCFVEEDIDTGLKAWKQVKNIEVRAMEEPEAGADEMVRSTEAASQPMPVPARLGRGIRNDWRVASFTAMTREVHQASRVAPGGGGDFALDYPAGNRVGLFLHGLLEHLDPASPLRPQLQELAPRLALRHGLSPEQDLEGLAGWLAAILDTPLNDDGLSLRALREGRALHELPFDFGTGPVSPEALDRLLREQPLSGIDPETLPALDFPRFQGMVTGVIDLVFEHQGRYYLADYKSNLLGRRLGDYAPHCLAAEIGARRYDLQCLLYTLALHRHLRERLPEYRYADHFGGVYYLFLRGMRPDNDGATGVWFERPASGLVEALDQTLFAPAREEALS